MDMWSVPRQWQVAIVQFDKSMHVFSKFTQLYFHVRQHTRLFIQRVLSL